jgi:hypothetical protein
MVDYTFISSITAAIAIGIAGIALYLNAKSFLKIRHTEQVRLVEGILRDVRALNKEHNLLTVQYANQQIPEFEKERLAVLRDHIFGALNWFAYLVKTKEITDEVLIFYFRGSVLKWHAQIFLKYMDEEALNNPDAYNTYKWLVKKYQTEARQSNT